MMGPSAIRLAALVLAAALALSGCRAVTDGTKFYALSSLPASPGDPAPTALSTAGIGVGPVLLPGYLDRPHVVTRGGDDALEISMYHRWAEPLERGIAEVLASNLAGQIGSERIAVFPWRGGVARAFDYQVVVTVLRFEGTPGGQVTLDTRWRLLGKDGQELTLKRSTITEPITGEGYHPVVGGMNRALTTLAREIAAEIRGSN